MYEVFRVDFQLHYSLATNNNNAQHTHTTESGQVRGIEWSRWEEGKLLFPWQHHGGGDQPVRSCLLWCSVSHCGKLFFELSERILWCFGHTKGKLIRPEKPRVRPPLFVYPRWPCVNFHEEPTALLVGGFVQLLYRPAALCFSCFCHADHMKEWSTPWGLVPVAFVYEPLKKQLLILPYCGICGFVGV